MITEKQITDAVRVFLKDTGQFPVQVLIRPRNRITVFIDGDQGITIDDCHALNRHLEGILNRDKEDFDLTVSSAGADRPLMLPRQYRRHIGRTLEVETPDGRKMNGILEDAGETGIALRVTEVISKKESRTLLHTLLYPEIKSARIVLTFKK